MIRTSARVLSTTELGGALYAQASSTNSWPVQLCIEPSPSDTPTTRYKVIIDNVGDVDDGAFSKTWHGDLRATATLPEGKQTYQVYRDGKLVSESRVQVQAGEAPLGTTRLASELTERRPSGVTQMEDSVEGKAKVRFVYSEETHSVREVFAIGDGVNTKLHREDSGDFVGEGSMDVGKNNIRFRVVPREWTRPEVAAYTRLGWDDCAGERGVLVTWALPITIVEFVDEGKAKAGGGMCTREGMCMVVAGVLGILARVAFVALVGAGSEKSGDKEESNGNKEDKEDKERPAGDVEDTDVLKHMRSLSV